MLAFMNNWEKGEFFPSRKVFLIGSKRAPTEMLIFVHTHGLHLIRQCLTADNFICGATEHEFQVLITENNKPWLNLVVCIGGRIIYDIPCYTHNLHDCMTTRRIPYPHHAARGWEFTPGTNIYL